MTDFGLSRKDFTEDEREILEHIEKHIDHYGAIPSLETVASATDFQAPDGSDEPLDFWADEIKTRSARSKIRKDLPKVAELLREGDTEKAIDAIRDLSEKLARYDGETPVILGADAAVEVLRRHDEIQRKGKPAVEVPYGFPYLDKMSGGLQPTDSVLLVGPTGIGKTFVLLSMAEKCHAAGKIPLVISMEMQVSRVASRWLALRTALGETRIRTGLLNTYVGRERLEINVARAQEEHPFYFIDGGFVFEIEDLIPHVRRLKPDAVYIDGAYIMKTRGRTKDRYEGMATTAEQIKLMALRTESRVVSTYQLDGKGRTFGGRTMDHLASVVLHLTEDEGADYNNEWGNKESRIIQITKGRSGEYGTFRIIYNMKRTRIEQAEVLTGEQETEAITKKRKSKNTEKNRDESTNLSEF
jgi:replicative DNA helicase